MNGRRIGIIGAGLMGLSLARKLANDGHEVTVIERSSEIGGLATWHDFGGFYWDRFYHVILPSDRNLIQFVRDLGLEDDLTWRRTYTGFYVDKTLHSISSNMEFLRFPLLSLFSKARLAWTMLYGSRIKDWQRLESVTVEDWLLQVSGRENYEKLWKPLLLAKLGPSYKRVSAVFIWSYIARLFSARDTSASAEQLGHVRGGYKQIFEALCSEIQRTGGRIELNREVTRIRPNPAAGVDVTVDSQDERYDKVICTSPVSVLKRITVPELIRVTSPGGEVEYLGVVCGVLVTRAPTVPYYVVNIADEQLPFTGVIGMSNVIEPQHTSGKYLTYLPKYILSSDAEMRRDDAYFEKLFLDGFREMLPDFEESMIDSLHINRAPVVQPLQVLGYSGIVPEVETAHPDFFVLNTSQFVNATLNNNEVIGAVNRFYEKHSTELAA